jgi:hypothetical protein
VENAKLRKSPRTKINAKAAEFRCGNEGREILGFGAGFHIFDFCLLILEF